MILANAILDVIRKQGVDLAPGKAFQVKRLIGEALRDSRFRFIEKEGKTIGFFTWIPQDGGVFFNNLFILKQYRNSKNMIYLRGIFREKFHGQKFYWKNRKKNKEVNTH